MQAVAMGDLGHFPRWCTAPTDTLGTTPWIHFHSWMVVLKMTRCRMEVIGSSVEAAQRWRHSVRHRDTKRSSCVGL